MKRAQLIQTAALLPKGNPLRRELLKEAASVPKALTQWQREALHSVESALKSLKDKDLSGVGMHLRDLKSALTITLPEDAAKI